jgi:hypothetical protein
MVNRKSQDRCERPQWQAQEGAQEEALEAAGVSEGLTAGAAVSVAGAGALSLLSALAGAALAPPLKSVAYQPEPLSWKPAAVSCLVKDGLLQTGHTLRGGSDIFCKWSLAKPQALHL